MNSPSRGLFRGNGFLSLANAGGSLGDTLYFGILVPEVGVHRSSGLRTNLAAVHPERTRTPERLFSLAYGEKRFRGVRIFRAMMKDRRMRVVDGGC